MLFIFYTKQTYCNTWLSHTCTGRARGSCWNLYKAIRVGKKSDAVTMHSGKTLLWCYLQVIFVLHIQIHTEDPNYFVLITTVSSSTAVKNKLTVLKCKGKTSAENMLVQPWPEDTKNREKEVPRKWMKAFIHPFKMAVFKMKTAFFFPPLSHVTVLRQFIAF